MNPVRCAGPVLAARLPAPSSPVSGAGRTTALGVALLLGIAASAAAQTPPVAAAPVPALVMRSGEHASFTRLTLPLLPGQTWQLGRTADGYGLRLPGNAATLDIAGVWDRIPRSRLADLRPMAEGIDLILGCACNAIAFEEGDLLVIDLRDGPPPAGARFEARLAGPVRPAPAPSRTGFDWTRRFVATDAAAGFDNALPGSEGAPRFLALPDTAPGLAEGAARDMLVRYFARAAAQGLIGSGLPGTAPPAQGAPTLSVPPLSAPGTVATAIPAPGARADPAQNLLIGAETAVDRARRGGLRPELTPDGATCLPDRLFALEDWGDDSPAAVQIARTRAGLLGEFDAPDPAAVLGLVRLYLHLGFGAEAETLLRTLPVAMPEAQLLAVVASLVDEALPRPDAPFVGMEGCDGAVALWAVLAAPALTPGQLIDRAAVLRSFSALPLPLRRHLGPPLARRFLDLGDEATARALSNAISRAPGDHGSGLELLEAGLALAEGRPEAASDTLAPVVTANAPDAAEALALMVEARLDAGLPIDIATADSLTVMARERRGTALGTRLARLEALALAMTGRFDAGFAVRDRIARTAASDSDAEETAALDAELLALLAERAGEVAFLTRLFAEEAWRDGALPPAPRRQIATRLIAAGFPDAARAALPAPEDAAPEDMVLAAQAALALRDGQAALRLIAGLTGPEAAALRGAALEALGEYRAAAQAYLDAAAPQAAARAALLGGDWAQLAALDDGPAAGLAARRLAADSQATDPEEPGDGVPPDPAAAAGTPPEAPSDDDMLAAPSEPAPATVATPSDPTGALARAEALLASSSEARALVQALLSESPPPLP